MSNPSTPTPGLHPGRPLEAASQKQIYLGKEGQTFGPYSESDFEALKTSPEYRTYAWIWDTHNPQWRPLEPTPPPSPPPLPSTRPLTLVHSNPEMDSPRVPEFHGNQPSTSRDFSGFVALCHDFRSLANGVLKKVTDAGCEFVSEQEHPGSVFSPNSKLILNLLDPQSHRSVTVSVRMDKVGRRNGKWHYQLRWKKCPQLV